MSPITTHVLDTAGGHPASGLAITLEHKRDAAWTEIAAGRTNSDGRITDLLPSDRPLEAGDYRMTFDTGGYFRASRIDGFYPRVQVEFTIRDGGQHYHVPLLLSPFGYSTYRGS